MPITWLTANPPDSMCHYWILSQNADGSAMHKQITLTLKENPKWPIEMPGQLA